MDITSLPQEILAKVLKYQDFATFYQLRKLSSQVNSVTKRCGITKRVPLSHMHVAYRGGKFCVHMIFDKSFAKSYGISVERRYVYPFSEINAIEKLAHWAERVTIDRLLSLSECFRLDETLLLLLSDHKESFKHCKSFRIVKMKVDLSIEENKQLLKVFPKLEEIALEMDDKACSTLINMEVLGGRRWSKMSLIHEEKIQFINEDFLMEMASNCESIHMSFPLQFTFEVVVNMIKKLVHRRGFVLIRLGRIHLGDVTQKEAEEILRSIDGVSSVEAIDGIHKVYLSEWDQMLMFYFNRNL